MPSCILRSRALTDVGSGRSFTLVFAGLAAALGAVIDDAVIDVDRVRARLDERRGGSRLIAIAASMLVALLVTPALSLFLLSKVRGDAHPSPLLRWRRGSSGHLSDGASAAARPLAADRPDRGRSRR
jgi:Cu/Ag efflux pump CusA